MRDKKMRGINELFFSRENRLAAETNHVNNVPFSFSLEGGNSEETLSSQASTQHNSFGPAVIGCLTPNFRGNVTQRIQAPKSPDCFLNYY